MRRPLLSNAAWYLAGNTCYAICQWGMLVVLAKLGGPNMVGQFALGLATSAPIFLFANLQLRALAVTDHRDEHSFGDYLGLRLATTAAAWLVTLAISFTFAADTALVLLAVSTAKAFESISDLYHGDLQRRERMKRIALWLILKGICSLAALAVTIWITKRTAFGAAAMALVWGVVLLGGEMRTAPSRFQPRWSTPVFRRLIRMALPMGAVTMLISLNTNIPRYFIDRLRGSSDLGIFAALVYLTVAGSTVINALGQSAVPRLSAMHAAGDLPAFRQLLGRLLAFAALLGAAGIAVLALFGQPVLTFFFRSEFAAHTDAALWIMGAGALLFVASPMGYAMTAARHFDIQLPLFVAVTAATSLAAALLIPSHGLLGAAWTMLVTGIAQLGGSAAVVFWILRRSPVVELEAAEALP